ncbi:MAG: hypothetical protein OEU50_06650 [Gammaproteobacteria bacterium]|nr:hypothetical protein [Gammaproteobacteria bacterium]
MTIGKQIFTTTVSPTDLFGARLTTLVPRWLSTAGLHKVTVTPVFIVLVAIALLNGCATSSTQQSSSTTAAVSLPEVEPALDKATVVYLRPSALNAGARKASLFDITEGAQFLAILPNGTKTIAKLEPGVHMFMATIAGMRGVMQAEVEAGKVYYIRVYASQLTPLSPVEDGKRINKYWSSTKPVTVTEADLEWDRNNRNSIEKHAKKAHTTWNKLSEDRQQEFRIGLEDGV